MPETLGRNIQIANDKEAETVAAIAPDDQKFPVRLG